MYGVVSKFVTGDENSHRFGRIPKGAMTGALWADVMQERAGLGVSLLKLLTPRTLESNTKRFLTLIK